MRALTGGDTDRSALSSSLKENLTMCSENEGIMRVLKRHEMMLADIQKQMRLKVNKSDYTAGLSSKVSLSDITNITMDLNNEDSIRMNHSNTILLHSLQQQLTAKTKQFQERNIKIEEYMKIEVGILKKELNELQKQVEVKVQALSRSIVDREKPLRDIFEQKAERSQIEKVTNLSGLLAIEFQQIRKRFNSFESEQILVWKELSNLKQEMEEVNKKAFISKEQQQSETQKVQSLREVTDIKRNVRQLKKDNEDHDYSLKLFGQRLGVVENYHQNWFKSLKQIEKVRKEISQEKEEVEQLHILQLRIKDECLSLIQEKVKEQVCFQSGSIKTEIKQACCELTDQMVKIFQKCAKTEDLYHTTDMVDQLQDVLNQKIKNLTLILKKNQDQNIHKNQVNEQKMRVMQRDIQSRLKKEQFKEHRGQLITTNQATSLVKKAENGLKKNFDQFATQQKEVNEVLCSQNVLTRWAWTSGTLKGGNLVAWDRQLVNTLPENFLYSKDEYCFRVISGGIYRFELGFYSKKKPTIQIIVNGQTIISAVNSSSYVVHHSSGKLKDICVNEVSGLTYYDFFTLQDNSRIAVSYCGEVGHGFIGLQRM